LHELGSEKGLPLVEEIINVLGFQGGTKRKIPIVHINNTSSPQMQGILRIII
jgi:hypothetical protein